MAISGERTDFSKYKEQDFSGGPVVKTLHCQCRVLGYSPWLGNYDPTCCTTQPKDERKKERKKENKIQGTNIESREISPCKR